MFSTLKINLNLFCYLKHSFKPLTDHFMLNNKTCKNLAEFAFPRLISVLGVFCFWFDLFDNKRQLATKYLQLYPQLVMLVLLLFLFLLQFCALQRNMKKIWEKRAKLEAYLTFLPAISTERAAEAASATAITATATTTTTIIPISWHYRLITTLAFFSNCRSWVEEITSIWQWAGTHQRSELVYGSPES